MYQVLYEWLLAVHILMAIIWVGGGITGQILVSRMRAADGARMVKTAADLEWIGMHVYFPASIILLLAGILMVIEAQWGFTTPWVLIGLIGFGITVVMGMAVLGPQIKKIHAAVEEKGPDDPEVQAQLGRLFVLSRIDLAVLILVVIDMAVKPTF